MCRPPKRYDENSLLWNIENCLRSRVCPITSLRYFAERLQQLLLDLRLSDDDAVVLAVDSAQAVEVERAVVVAYRLDAAVEALELRDDVHRRVLQIYRADVELSDEAEEGVYRALADGGVLLRKCDEARHLQPLGLLLRILRAPARALYLEGVLAHLPVAVYRELAYRRDGQTLGKVASETGLRAVVENYLLSHSSITLQI